MDLVLVIAVVAAAALAFFWPEGETIGGIEGGAVIANSVFGLMAVVMAASLLQRYRGRLGSALRDLALWALIVAAILVAYVYRDALQPIYGRVMAELAPGRVISSAPGLAQVVRRKDGHFALDAMANGVKLSFMFDTGASLVVLRAEDAGKLGFDVETLAWSATVQTANGPARAAPVTLKALTIGGITERNLRALVAKRGALGENLLGQSFLERLAAYGVEGDVLTLKAKPAQ